MNISNFKLVLIIACFGLTSCFKTKKIKKAYNQAFVIDYVFERIVNDGHNKEEQSSLNTRRIAYIDQFIVYELPTVNYEVFAVIKSRGKIINKLRPRDTLFTYYVTKQGIDKGISFDNINQINGKVFKVDSLLHAIALDPPSLEIFSIPLGSPAKRIYQNTFIEEEHYFVKQMTTDPDSIIRIYNSDIKKIPLSFSATLDKLKDSKLQTIIFVYSDPKKGLTERITKGIQYSKIQDTLKFKRLVLKVANKL